MPRRIWAGAASRDLDAIEIYLTGFDPDLAMRTVAEIIAASRRLEDHHRIGSPRRGERRSPVGGRTPYPIVYEVGRDIDILRVFHARQDWRR